MDIEDTPLQLQAPVGRSDAMASDRAALRGSVPIRRQAPRHRPAPATNSSSSDGSSGADNNSARSTAAAAAAVSAPSARVFLHTFGCGHNVSDGEYMAGQLSADGHTVSDEFAEADCYVINSCTVKNPSEDHFVTMLRRACDTGRPVIVAGCVPQGDPKNKQWADVSVVGVRQIDRIGYVVSEALQGNTVRILDADGGGGAEGAVAATPTTTSTGHGGRRGKQNKKHMPALSLPKVRRNRLIEIVPINVGCLNFCTYCKTKHARGDLQSWPVEDIVRRVRAVVAEGVVEIRMTSEDTGAYGIDIGTDIVALLRAVVRELEGTRVMLRLGMSNPPYLLRHLDGMCDVLRHPNVFEYLHLPVQAGANAILDVMNREYTVEEFELCVDTFRRHVPRIGLSTDIICAFPGEGDAEWAQTMALCAKHRFPYLNISRFYARRDTPAAAMRQVPSTVSKQRSVALTAFYNSYGGFNDFLVGTEQDLWLTEVAHDKHHLVGHTKEGFVQVLVDPAAASMGDHVTVRVVSATKYSATGTVVRVNDTARVLRTPPPPPPHADETGVVVVLGDCAASAAPDKPVAHAVPQPEGDTSIVIRAAAWLRRNRVDAGTGAIVCASLVAGYFLARRHVAAANSS